MQALHGGGEVVGLDLELGGDPTLERSGRGGPTLRALAIQLRERGISVLEGPLMLTSRTGPAASSYPTVWSTDYAGQLYAPPVGPVTLHENTISLNLRPGRDVGSPPSFVWAYPAGVDRLVRMSATTVGGKRRRLALIANNEGGWTLAGTIGIDSRIAGISAVAHDPVRVLAYAWAAALERDRRAARGRRQGRARHPAWPGARFQGQSSGTSLRHSRKVVSQMLPHHCC